jgi:hypothetical protein
LRIALLDPARVPVTHHRVEGVPDDVLGAYYEEERHEELELAAFVAQHGGVLHEIRSRATSLALTAHPKAATASTRSPRTASRQGSSLATRRWTTRFESALTYGHPPGTLTWKEVPGNS